VDLLTLKNSAKVIALIGMFISAFFTLPLFVGLFLHENINAFMLFDITLFMACLLLFVVLLRHQVKLRIKDAILTVNLIWLLLGVLGAIPLMLSTHVGFVDGFFESVSGFTTTGATIYGDIEDLPKHILLLRSLMHWLGGMGIIVLGVGLLSLINPTGSMALFKAEATGTRLDKMSAKIKDTAVKIWGVYLLLTVIDMLLLWAEGMGLFDALNHAFSTMSTGGFSTKNNSMAFWADSPLILWTTILFMLLAGINFLAHVKLLKGNVSGYKTEETKWYMIVFFLLSIGLTYTHYNTSHDGIFDSITHAFFTIASILTTTGFVSVNYELWGVTATVLILMAMLIGGNAGSTAGGFKVSRYVVLLKNMMYQTRRLLHPKAITSLYVDGNRITYDTLGVITGFAFLFIVSNLLLTAYLYAGGYDLMTSLSAAISMVSNIGPGFAKVGAIENYHFFTDMDKLVMSFFMILGRLEFYTVIMLFSRTYWKRF
jgi:trk system potassium uptake protein TrkH